MARTIKTAKSQVKVNTEHFENGLIPKATELKTLQLTSCTASLPEFDWIPTLTSVTAASCSNSQFC